MEKERSQSSIKKYPSSDSDASTIDFDEYLTKIEAADPDTQAKLRIYLSDLRSYEEIRLDNPRSIDITDTTRLAHLSETELMMNALGFIPACVASMAFVSEQDTVFALVMSLIALTTTDVLFVVVKHMYNVHFIVKPTIDMNRTYEPFNDIVQRILTGQAFASNHPELARLAEEFRSQLKTYKRYKPCFLVAQILFFLASTIRVAHLGVSITLCVLLGKNRKPDIDAGGLAQIIFSIWILMFNMMLAIINCWKSVFHGLDMPDDKSQRN
ncbi:hypothetical protein EC973_004640 [Apophysomyces ossiformis]|uniref:Uncharacterized protein n=1 Tax=Apophysomyces ossiformis TaxID=679940 RepID=A0A8H7ELN4_9FUNG|nr:hypothetical protein EC973_004640 [Apophysomyces ossiformis]